MKNKIIKVFTNPHIQQGVTIGISLATGAATIAQLLDSRIVDTIRTESKAIQDKMEDVKVSNQKDMEKIIQNQDKLLEEFKKQQFNRNSPNVTLENVNQSIGIVNGVLRIFTTIGNVFTGVKGNKKNSEHNGEDVSGYRDSSDESFSTPLSGRAHRNRQRERDN